MKTLLFVFLFAGSVFAETNYHLPRNLKSIALTAHTRYAEVSPENAYDYMLTLDLATGKGNAVFKYGFEIQEEIRPWTESCNFDFQATNFEITELRKLMREIRYSEIIDEEEMMDLPEDRAHFSTESDPFVGLRINKYRSLKSDPVWKYFSSGQQMFYDFIRKIMNRQTPQGCPSKHVELYKIRPEGSN